MIKSFNVFRILGALSIFLCHCGYIDGSIPLDMFFVLSGFCIDIGYANKISSHSLHFKDFILKRIRKIYYVYLLMTMVGYIYMTMLCNYGWGITTLKLPGHLLFLQPWVSHYCTAFNGAAWYVAALIWIYCMYYAYSIKHSNIVIWVWVIVWIFMLEMWGGKLSQFHFDIDHNPLTCFVYFYFGVIASQVYRSYKPNISKGQATTFETLFLVFLLFLIISSPHVKIFLNSLICLFISEGYFIFGQEKGLVSQFFKGKVFGILAAYSFHFYMVHYMVIQYFRRLHGVNDFSPFQTLFLFVLTIFFSCVLKIVDDKIHKA